MTHVNSEESLTNKNNVPFLLPIIIWGLGCAFYFYEFLVQVSPNVMSQELMREFSITSHQLGNVVGVYFYSYSFLQLPAGMLLDYFGPRRLLTIAALICGASTLAFSMTNSAIMAGLARFMIGFGSAFAAIGTMKLAANWFKANKFAFLTGAMVALGMFGAFVGEAPLALMLQYYNWRHALMILGVIGLCLSLLIFLIVRDSPDKKSHAKADNHEPVFSSLLKLIKNKHLWLVALYGGLMFMWTPVFCGLWGAAFLKLKLGISKSAAAYYVSLVFVGWAIASPMWGTISNMLGRRKPPMYIGSMGALLTSLLFLYAPIQSSFSITVLMLLFGIFSAGFLPAFAVAKEICDQRYVATGLAFMNMMNMIGIAIAHPIIGWILDLLWQGEFINSVRYYPLEAYYKALSILPLGILISLLILPMVKETYCHHVDDKTTK